MAKADIRRRLLTGIAATLTLPVHAEALRALAPMTDGPYYPPKPWRDRLAPPDADLTKVAREGATLTAMGEHLSLELKVVDRQGHPLQGVVVEIWQCDALKSYHHPLVTPQKETYDEGFAGFGRAVSGADGGLRFRTIRPVPYTGNSPHIHLKAMHDSFGVLTSRLWVEGDPDNARDYNWMQTELKDRPGLAFRIEAAPRGAGVRWLARHTLVMPV